MGTHAEHEEPEKRNSRPMRTSSDANLFFSQGKKEFCGILPWRVCFTTPGFEAIVVPRRAVCPKDIVLGADARVAVERARGDDDYGTAYVGYGRAALGAKTGRETLGFGQLEVLDLFLACDPSDTVGASEDVRGMGRSRPLAATGTVAHVKAVEWPRYRELNCPT